MVNCLIYDYLENEYIRKKLFFIWQLLTFHLQMNLIFNEQYRVNMEFVTDCICCNTWRQWLLWSNGGSDAGKLTLFSSLHWMYCVKRHTSPLVICTQNTPVPLELEYLDQTTFVVFQHNSISFKIFFFFPDCKFIRSSKHWNPKVTEWKKINTISCLVQKILFSAFSQLIGRKISPLCDLTLGCSYSVSDASEWVQYLKAECGHNPHQFSPAQFLFP